MKKNAHIVMIPWTGVGLHGGFRGNVWYKHRIEIFKEYTLKSLANQSNKNFLLWCSFRPEEKTNPLTKIISDAIEETRLPYIFTFDGLMYWDDKFSNYSLKTKIRNFLMMLWDCWTYKEWKNPLSILKLSWEDKNKSLLKRLTTSLETVRDTIGSNFDWVYLTRIDSDDMFHRNTIDLIQSCDPDYKRALVFDKGYILNVQTRQVAEWSPPTNPPFHTIIFPAKNFFDSFRHKEYYGNFRTHEDVPKVFNAVTLDMNSYMVAFHGKHISTSWTSPMPRYVYQKVKY